MKKLIYKILFEILKPYVIDTLKWIVAEYSSGLLSHNHLQQLIRDGVITADPANVNAASIDIRLGRFIYVEDHPKYDSVVNLSEKESPKMRRVELGENGYSISPGEFILAESQEVFNLPDNIVAEYVLKSSQARSGLNHMLAGYCDPGWHGAKLTLELKNELQRHSLTIRPGDKIGQMKFFRVEPVPDHASYRNNGRYNKTKTVTQSKGIV